jgi:hypothetical protein
MIYLDTVNIHMTVSLLLRITGMSRSCKRLDKFLNKKTMGLVDSP